MEENKDLLFEIDSFGKLYLKCVLLEYIYPRVFVCENDSEANFLFYEIESDHNHDRWLVTEITNDEYIKLLFNEVSIQSVYKKSNKQKIFSITKLYDTNSFIVENDCLELLNVLPGKDVYSEKAV